MKNNPTINARKRKALLLFPVLIIPFLTLAFWALGGGKDAGKTTDSTTSGLNLNLPSAQLKDDKGENKMSFYNAAQREATMQGDSVSLQPLQEAGDNGRSINRDYPLASPPHSTSFSNGAEAKIYQKLAQIDGQLACTTSQPVAKSPSMLATGTSTTAAEERHLEQLEARLRSSGTTSTEPDPELESLNGMMEKILDIQHPERVRERLQTTGDKKLKEGLSVSANRSEAYTSLLGVSSSKTVGSEFWSTDEETEETSDKGTIEAVVHGTQNLVDGSIIKLRLSQDLFVGTQTVLKGAFLFGTVTLQGERAQITINSIQYGGTILPVDLAVYDMDGLQGIFVPGAISREAVKTSTDGAVQSLEIGMMDPSLKAKAASAGLSTIKSLLGKKTRQERIIIKAGYQVFLKNTKESSN